MKELYVNALRDIYNTENQLTKALPKMVKAATSVQMILAENNRSKLSEELILSGYPLFSLYFRLNIRGYLDVYAEQICKIMARAMEKKVTSAIRTKNLGMDKIRSSPKWTIPNLNLEADLGKASKTKTNPRIPTQIKCRMKKKPPISQLKRRVTKDPYKGVNPPSLNHAPWHLVIHIGSGGC